MKKFILLVIFLSIFCNLIYADDIKTKAGKKFIIKLKANPTTGYTWDYYFKSDEGLIKFIDKKYIPKKNYKKLVGSGGEEIFRFKALKNGTSEIFFKYHRSWEKDIQEVDAKTFKILVKNGKNK